MNPISSWSGVTAAIARREAAGVTLGVAAEAPTGELFSHNGARRFVAASVVKIAIMIELFRQVDAGRVSLEACHRLRPEDKSAGSGVIGQMHDGIEFTLADLAYLMMSISDNSATNILIDHVGQDQVNRTMRELGMAGSTLGRGMRGRRVEGEEQENWAVPDEYVRVVRALFDGSAASAGSCVRMLALLELQQNERRIARHLPSTDRPRWGSKTGSLPGLTNDVGFVMTDRGPLIIAAFCELPDPHEGEQIIGDIARALLADVGGRAAGGSAGQVRLEQR